MQLLRHIEMGNIGILVACVFLGVDLLQILRTRVLTFSMAETTGYSSELWPRLQFAITYNFYTIVNFRIP